MSPNLKPLAEQVMVVIGASSGIGLVTARRAAAAGAHVVLVARSGDVLAAVVADIARDGGTASHVIADVTDPAAMRAVAQAAIDRHGRIDAWVHVAGVTIYAKLEDTPEDEHQALFQTNYFGMVHGSLAALPHLKRSRGSLIVVGSIASDLPAPVQGAYAASKHAVKAWVTALRMELIRDQAPVSVTLIKPSGIDTPIGRNAANHGADRWSGEAKVPPPAYDPDLVADAILHAAAHPSRELTVGGVGQAQIVFARLLPGLTDRLAGLIVPFLFDPRRPAPRGSALAAPQFAGDERRTGTGRRVSLFTAAELHPRVATAGLVALAGGLALLAWRRRPPLHHTRHSRAGGNP